MKKLTRLFSLLIIFVLFLSFTGCTGNDDAKYKSVELNTDNIELISITKIFEKGQTVEPLAVNALGDLAGKAIFIGYVDVLTSVVYLNGAALPDTANFLTYRALYINSEVIDKTNNNYAFVGFLVTNPDDDSDIKLYTNKSSILLDKQPAIFVEYDEDKNIPFPIMNVDGSNFSGWYTDEEYKAGTRVANITALTNSEDFTGVVYARYLGYGEAAIVSVICVLIVFSMLALLWGIVSLMKFINKFNKPKKQKEEENKVVETPRQPLKLEDIKDDDMMAAALVATIDYHEETKEDVRVVSIKEIK